MKNKVFFLFFISLPFIQGCKFFEPSNSEFEIARVGERYLYNGDIEDITYDLTGEDSIEVANTYIDNWIKEQLLLQKAIQNLNEAQIDFEKQLENYRNSLIIYAYENQLIKQKLDTLVSNEEVLRYYNKNQSNFELKHDLFRGRLIKCLISAPNQDSLKYWLDNAPLQFEEKLVSYCAQFTLRCDIDTSNWLSINAVRKLLPENVRSEELNLKVNSIAVYEDTTSRLYINTWDYRKKGEAAPVQYVKNQIIEIIRNRRKLELISSVKDEIFEEATLNRKYEIYIKE